MQKYENRRAAGLILAKTLRPFCQKKNIIVLALPRGGVPVAYEVAKALHAPLDVFLVRKLGVPGHNELAMGAIAEGGATIFNEDIVDKLRISEQEIDAVATHENEELNRRGERYRGKKSLSSLKNKTVILIDDGIATGATIKVAMLAVRQQQPQEIIAAVPVADVHVQRAMEGLCDHFVCPMLVDQLQAVGLWYQDFSQTEDDEVIELLHDANQNVS